MRPEGNQFGLPAPLDEKAVCKAFDAQSATSTLGTRAAGPYPVEEARPKEVPLSVSTEHSAAVQTLIGQIDRAAEAEGPDAICRGVKRALMAATDYLPDALLAPTPGHYARRLLYKDPKGRYSIIVMVWDVGQGTPLHDHAGQWCVECVYAGRIRVRSFELTERDGDRCRFEFRSEVFAGVGEAGTLIPPFEYHILENAGESKAVTVHVYHGELTWCHAFFPEDEAEGVYRRERKALGYSD